jgi:hypothetical protein
MHGDDAITGTPSSGILKKGQFSSDDLAAYPDDYFDDWHGRFYGGAHRDIDFAVTAFEKEDNNQNKGVIAFTPDLSEIATVGDLFEMYPDYRPAEINDAINQAITMVEDEALQDVVDASIAIVASTFEYNVPSDLVFIDQLYQETGTAGAFRPSRDAIDYRHWRVLHDTPPRIWFDSNYTSLTTGRKLRLVGQRRQSQLVLDSDMCSIRTTFLVYQAKALLHLSRIRGQGADSEQHTTEMAVAQGMADRERVLVRVAGRGRVVSY